jgi:ubiquinone/menaquinone biosynthesis C-methylase UbiE
MPVFLRENEVGRRLAAHLEPGMEVLDVGAGTGMIARWLWRRVNIRPTLADVADFDNRVHDFPFLRVNDPRHLPTEDRSFDAVLMLFVLHHVAGWDEQEQLLREAARVARGRLLLLEDTPTSALDRVVNVGWDWILNLRHGVPKPFTFRTVEGWRQVFPRCGLRELHTETYRARWPSLMTYRHSLFVLEPIASLAHRTPDRPGEIGVPR